MKQKNKSKQVNKYKRAFIAIDPELHRQLKIKAAAEKTTIKTLVEGALADLLSVEGSKENREKFYE